MVPKLSKICFSKLRSLVVWGMAVDGMNLVVTVVPLTVRTRVLLVFIFFLARTIVCQQKEITKISVVLWRAARSKRTAMGKSKVMA
jgi:hypothetical protein